MDTLKEIWNGFVSFLKEHDVAYFLDALRGLDWQELLTNPVFWVVALSFSGFMIWKKQLKMFVLLVSMAAFVMLLQVTLPPAGESMDLSSILEFIGGSAILAIINLYFFLIRQ